MLRWFRARASHVAVVVMLSLGVVGASAVSPHEDDCHDAACRSMAVEHDADAHRIVAPPTDSGAHPQHCLVCHWVRSFRPPIETRLVSAPVAEAGIPVHVALVRVAASASVAQPPLRSPPHSPTHS